MSLKPILFNTEMVRALLEGRKTVTRRVVKPQPVLDGHLWKLGGAAWSDSVLSVPVMLGHSLYNRAPYQPGDVLWVRETWDRLPVSPGGHFRPNGVYYYRADGDTRPEPHTYKAWHPSIHMHKEAARIFLRVTGVRPERLREMVLADLLMEGVREAGSYEETWAMWHYIWDSTIGPGERLLYGWKANPWVWVISFERVDRPEPST